MYIILISWVTPTPNPRTPTPDLIIIFPIENFKNKSRSKLIGAWEGFQVIHLKGIGESILYSEVLKKLAMNRLYGLLTQEANKKWGRGCCETNQKFLPMFLMPISSVSKEKIGASAYPSTPPPSPAYSTPLEVKFALVGSASDPLNQQVNYVTSHSNAQQRHVCRL